MFVTPEVLDEDVREAVKRLTYWIERLQAERDISKGMLIRLSGLTKQGVNYILDGRREPGLRSIAAIARALDVEAHQLLAPIPDEDANKQP